MKLHPPSLRCLALLGVLGLALTGANRVQAQSGTSATITFDSDTGAPVVAPPDNTPPTPIAYAPSTLPTLPIEPGGTGTAPAITTQPASLTLTAGAEAVFSVAATGTPAPNYQWLKDGSPIAGANSATYTIAAVATNSQGVYRVIVSNNAGAVLSAKALLSVIANTSVVFTAVPANVAASTGGSASFTIGSTDSTLSYVWSFDGDKIAASWALTNAVTSGSTPVTYTFPTSGNSSGDGTSVTVGGRDVTLTVSGTGDTLTFPVVGPSDTGNIRVKVYKGSSVAAVYLATLTVTSEARLTNLSSRGQVGTGDNILIVGFVNQGAGDKEVLLRGVGPTLGAPTTAGGFGVSGTLSTPEITLDNGAGTTLYTNSGWGNSASIAAAAAQVGAFPLITGSVDAALLESLPHGSYTAQVSGLNGGTGIALAEIYDADTGTPADTLVNISTRAMIAGGSNVLIAGFVVTGTTSEELLIRGVGPTLDIPPFGIAGALAGTKVTLFDSTGTKITANEDWSGDVRIAGAAAYTGAFPYAVGSRDAALLVTVPPGVYTAKVEGPSGTTGVGMVEIYEVK